jgi:hypothetical protein
MKRSATATVTIILEESSDPGGSEAIATEEVSLILENGLWGEKVNNIQGG